MPIRETVPGPRALPWTQEQLCAFAARWQIEPDLARRLQMMAQELPYEVQMISGARSRAQQEALDDAGRPAAPFELSTHANERADGCPRLATGADLSPTIAHDDYVRALFGRAAVLAGLRWGGGSPVDDRGFPSDWQHVDLGPRSQFP